MRNILSKFKKKEKLPQPFQLEQIKHNSIESPLLSFRKNVVSQDGEDGIIQEIFSIMKPLNKYCVEFGAWDGKYFSNTWNLIKNENWGALVIEGNSSKFKELTSTYSDNQSVTCLNRFVEIDGTNSLDSILKEVNAPKNLDLLSIDIDGIDYFIWDSLKEYRPRAIVIEFNPSIPNDIAFIQAKSNSINQGCSLLSLILLGKTKGYELVCCTGWNAFFVEKEFYGLFNIKDNHIDKLYQPICDGRIFHGYDSTVFVAGMPNLIWSQTAVDSSNFQVLSKEKRIFGDSQR